MAAENNENIKKPKIIVFDLDYTLWPFWIDTHVTPPFSRKHDSIVDAQGKKIKYYEQVPEILENLAKEGFEIGIASRTSEIKGAYQLLKLLNWDKYIKYTEIYPGCKITHFNKIKEASGVDFKDMIFFDDERRNIDDLTKVGVLSIYVKNGLNKNEIKNGLEQFKSRQ
ncbi:magnesium-dependent phosphatase 1-like [Microplitis mediator]|uniref:magnesium-dependent phosphatase 1-like n=1 Tax=Microplitis mediator TaxID=375433 RepID=UPI00255276F5|nr:magnesium-dependent phosphatase 1-like [Microplitis mediator]